MSDQTTPVTEAPADESPYTASPTRPATASHRSRRAARAPRKVTRYTLDLDHSQHMWLRLWSLQEGVEASRLCRALLLLCENDAELKERVLDEVFGEEPVAADGSGDGSAGGDAAATED